MDFSNAKVAKLLREIATAYTIKKDSPFKIKAYESAADGIEHLTSEIKDLWQNNQLDEIPGIGESLKEHLDELFKTGKVKHWESVKKGIPEAVFDFLDIPSVGPQTALRLAKQGVKDSGDLEKKIKNGGLLKLGFSQKFVDKLKRGFDESQTINTGRILLPNAFASAQKILDYLKEDSNVEKVDVLGSLRRMVATIGDLDFAIASNNPSEVIKHITSMSGISEVIDKGKSKVTIVISSGLHLDVLIAKPNSYGALLQHFTGSKMHNIHLRKVANDKGYSLSEDGVKRLEDGRSKSDDGKVIKIETEEELYSLLGMQTPAPEIREDTGEIEAALAHKLPHLINLKDIKGDLHIHSNYPIEPSHDLGVNTIEEMAKKGKDLGYEYIGIADHQPSKQNHTLDQMVKLIEKRKKHIEHINYSKKNIRVLNLLELDIMPDGALSVPVEALKLLDFGIAGVHSSHHQSKEDMTKRLIKVLENPYIKVLTHPTNRLLNEREASDADWDSVFKTAAKNKKALEISGYPNRLDLSDQLVRKAKSYGVKFVIDTDSHEVSQMEMMVFGVSVAKRGWLEKDDVINSWDWTKFSAWFKL